MRIVKMLIIFTLSLNSYSAELNISFRTQNLDHQDALIKVTMESSNPICSKIVVGIGGIAVGNRSKYVAGKIYSTGNRLNTKVDYQEGGFCAYKISELYLYFLYQKYAYFNVRISVLSKKDWSGGFLDFSELSSNQSSNLSITCEGNGKRSYSMCVTKNADTPYARGNSGNLYIWRENLREIDAYHGGSLIFTTK